MWRNMTVLMQPLSEPVTIRLIKTEADYEAALAELDGMIGHVEPGTPDGNRYALLAALVEAYEAANYPIDWDILHQRRCVKPGIARKS